MANNPMERASHSLIHIYDTLTGEDKIAAEFDTVAEAPFFTRDGSALYYNSEGKVYRLDLATGAITHIPTGEATLCNNDHVLNPDGTRMAVSSGHDGDWQSRIYTVNLATGESTCLTPEPHSYLHGWSPDGRDIAFCGARDYGHGLEWDIYTVPAAGGPQIRLTDAPGLNDGPEYSPDGRTIWFNSVRTGRMQVWKMNADGSGQTQMTFDEDWNAWFPHISPDGKTVVYLVYRKEDLEPGEHLPDKQVELRRIPARGGPEETVLSLFGGQGTINVNSWSPDSRFFAYVSYHK